MEKDRENKKGELGAIENRGTKENWKHKKRAERQKRRTMNGEKAKGKRNEEEG